MLLPRCLLKVRQLPAGPLKEGMNIVDDDAHPTTDTRLARVTLLDVQTVARQLGIHRRTVWRLVSTGDLPPPIRLGPKTVRWRLTDLEQHLQRVKP